MPVKCKENDMATHWKEEKKKFEELSIPSVKVKDDGSYIFVLVSSVDPHLFVLSLIIKQAFKSTTKMIILNPLFFPSFKNNFTRNTI